VENVVDTQADFKSKADPEPFLFRTIFGGFNDIPLLILVERRGALTLADLMMGGEGIELPGEASELYINAAQEGFSQVVGSAFTSLSALLGGRRLMPEKTSSSLGEEDWAPFSMLDDEGKVWSSTVNVEIEGLEPFVVKTALPLDSAKEIVDAIQQIMNEKAPSNTASPSVSRTPSPASQPNAAMPAASQSFSPPPTPGPLPRGAQQPGPLVDVHPAEFTPLVSKGTTGGGSRIDMIADIPVRVTVELGKTRKNISEILNMTTGSVIELDKMAGEAVDVLVNGKLIAKGEVVVIDENFGVRISEVLNTASRVHSM